MLKRIQQTIVATAALGAVFAAPVSAALDHQAIAQKLHSIGVTTKYGNCDSNAWTVGIYNSGTNHFCISNRIKTNALLEETVIHELVHVVQDCIGDGIASPRLGSVARYLSDGNTTAYLTMHQVMAKNVRNRYSPQHINRSIHSLGNASWIELEAYALEDNPRLVLGLLDRCN